MIQQWKPALLEGVSDVFERGCRNKSEIDEEQVKELQAKIGELAVANSFLERKLKPRGREVRRGMGEADHPQLSIGQQCKLLSIALSSFYYTPIRGSWHVSRPHVWFFGLFSRRWRMVLASCWCQLTCGPARQILRMPDMKPHVV
jgi:hypothetical protein